MYMDPCGQNDIAVEIKLSEINQEFRAFDPGTQSGMSNLP